MNFSMIDLCSKALAKIGASEIVSLGEGTPEAEAAASFYGLVKRKLLAGFSWSFATREASLARIAPDEGEASLNRFQLPGDFLRAVKVSGAAPYKIMGDRLHTAADGVILTYVADVGEEAFTPCFASALVYALAAEFAMALLDDGAKFNLFYKLHAVELKEARFLDSQQETPKKIAGFPIVDARK